MREITRFPYNIDGLSYDQKVILWNKSLSDNPTQGTTTNEVLYWDDTSKKWTPSATRFPATGANYTDIEADGTLEFNGNATVWKDMVFPMAPPKITGAGNPTLVSWNGNIRGYSFAVNDVHDFDPQEFSHDGKQASTATFHIHWISRTNVAAARTVKWEIEYTQANYSAVFPAASTANIEVTVPSGTTALTHYITDITTFTTANIASQMYVRLKRIASSGTEPADDPVVIGVHYHYEIDTIGSRGILTK